MTHQIIITSPTPVRSQDRCEGVPLNKLEQVFESHLFTTIAFDTLLWAAKYLTETQFIRLNGIIDSVACYDTWQAGQYTFIFRSKP